MSERPKTTEAGPVEHLANDSSFVEAVQKLIAIQKQDDDEIAAKKQYTEEELRTAIEVLKPQMQTIEEAIAEAAERYGVTSADDVQNAISLVKNAALPTIES